VHACSGWLAGELARFGIRAEILYLPVRRPGAGFRRAPAAEPRFVFVGRLCREKGVAHLIRAFRGVRAALPGATLRIVGSGPEREQLERIAAQLGIGAAVRFTGVLDDMGVDRELEEAWALVSPSLWAEPLGLSAVEAIVRGVPVVASRAGGHGETVEEGAAGLLYPNGDTKALEQSLLRVARRKAFPTLRPIADAVARAAVRHDVDAYVERLRAVYSEVAAESEPSTPRGRIASAGR
jgi:glycosyltransferase involved in cell wall biosynthesis